MRRSKFGNVRTHGFDSRAEYARHQELKLLEKAGKIGDLKRQIEFPLAIGPMLICKYRADFCYTDARTGESVVEDVKGVRTAIYRIKKKLMLALWGIRIREVDARDLRIRRK